MGYNLAEIGKFFDLPNINIEDMYCTTIIFIVCPHIIMVSLSMCVPALQRSMTTIQNDLSANMAQRVEAALRDGVNQILHIGVSSTIQLIIASVVHDCI